MEAKDDKNYETQNELNSSENTEKSLEELNADAVDNPTEKVEAIEQAEEITEEKVEEEPSEKEESEQEPEPEKPEEEFINYSEYTEVELINELRNLLEENDFVKLNQRVELIKIQFYKKHNTNIQEQKKAFIEAGNDVSEFKPDEDIYEADFKNLYSQFRQLKIKHAKDVEDEKEQNLKLKYEIIEEIKNLINSEETINNTFHEFQELQERWRNVGLIPQSSLKDLWKTYHHHVENFYDYIKINKELRDLDLKKNMQAKIKLCERAEALLVEPSVIGAFNALQKLHDEWREIGPVPRDNKEELWERFKAATKEINKNHQEFFESRKKSQKKNLEAKTALCEKVEELLTLELNNHKEWEEKSEEVVGIQKFWRTIGFAPKKENNSIYERFRKACDAFFDKKREFYAKHKEEQVNNLQLKLDLCNQAEAAQESTDWKKTTDLLISIQKKWKEIGPVPRKHSDAIWKRFRAACDHFFNQKAEFFSEKDSEQDENLQLKNNLIEEVEAFKISKDEKADFEKLREFQQRWADIGHVPIAQKNEVNKKFRDVINAQFDKLRVEDKDRNLMKFRSKAMEMKSSHRGENRLLSDRDKLVNRIKQIESDLITLKNNIGFFSNSKGAEALIKDVERKIAKNEEQIVYLKDKIRIIDEVEDQED